MHPNQRSGSSPTSQLDDRSPQPLPANRPYMGPAQPQPQSLPNDAVAIEPAATAPAHMVFPNPYAYAQNPVALETGEVSRHSNALPYARSDTTRTAATSGSTTSGTTAFSTAITSAEPDPSNPDDNLDGLPPFTGCVQ